MVGQREMSQEAQASASVPEVLLCNHGSYPVTPSLTFSSQKRSCCFSQDCAWVRDICRQIGGDMNEQASSEVSSTVWGRGVMMNFPGKGGVYFHKTNTSICGPGDSNSPLIIQAFKRHPGAFYSARAPKLGTRDLAMTSKATTILSDLLRIK